MASKPAMDSTSAKNCTLDVWSYNNISNLYFGFGGFWGRMEQSDLTESLKTGNTSVTKKLTNNELVKNAVVKSQLMTEFSLSPEHVSVHDDPNTAKIFFDKTAMNGFDCKFGMEIKDIWFTKEALSGRELTLFYKIFDRSKPGARPLRWDWYSDVEIKKFDNTLSEDEISKIIEDALTRVIDQIVAKKVTPKRARSR